MPRLTLASPRATRAFGRWVATKLEGGDVVSLQGSLGAGKTTLLQGLAAGLGIKRRSTSPTFILFRLVPLPRPRRRIRTLVHADAYRARTAGEFVAAGFSEYLGDPTTLTVIEWGDRLPRLLPRRTIKIKLANGPHPHERTVHFPVRLGRPPRHVAA